MVLDHFAGLISLRNDIVSGDLSPIDEFRAEEHWNVRDFIEILAVYKLIHDQVSNEALFYVLQTTCNDYLSGIRGGIRGGKISTLKGRERKPYRSSLPPLFSQKWSLSSYFGNIGRKLEMLNPADKLLAKYILPADATEFAISKGWPTPPNFASILETTVQESDLPLQLPARESIPVANGLHGGTIDSRIHILSTLKLKGLYTDLILAEIDVNDLNSLYKIISPPEKADPPTVAGKNERNRQRKIRAINYMLGLIKSGCVCRHSDLAKVASKNSVEWDDTLGKLLSVAQLKELSILIVHPKRRFRKNQVTGETEYDPSACKCEQPDHA